MTLHPVILPIPPQDQRLRGRERVLAQSRRAREALALSCDASGVSLGPLTTGARGAPIPFGNTHWSLSHKSRFVAAVVGPAPIGIDIEEIRPRNEELYGYVAGTDEWALGDRTWETFFRYWTAKEAVLKTAGVGISHLKKARIHALLGKDYLLVDYGSLLWPVKHLRFQDHIVALMHDDHEVAWDLRENPAPFTGGRS
jgi:4'-phosphopantetheinyl transferase